MSRMTRSIRPNSRPHSARAPKYSHEQLVGWGGVEQCELSVLPKDTCTIMLQSTFVYNIRDANYSASTYYQHITRSNINLEYPEYQTP